MCGRVNPENAETCQYCEARLKPVWQEGESSAAGSETGANADDFARWLASSSDLEPPALSGAEEDEPVPDWLKGLRDDVGSEHFLDDTSSDIDGFGGADAGEEELPDWLKDIVPTTETAAALPDDKPDLPQFQDEDPEWMRRIGSDSQFDPFAGGAGKSQPLEEDRETGEEVPPEPQVYEFMAEEAAPVEQTGEPDLPAWLSPEESEEGILDWLSKPTQFQDEAPSVQSENEGQFSSWLDSSTVSLLGEEPPLEAQPEDVWRFEQPVSEQQPAEEQPFEDLSPTDLLHGKELDREAVPAEYIPDWLTGMDAEGRLQSTESLESPDAEEPGLSGATEPFPTAGEIPPAQETEPSEIDGAAIEQPAFDSWGWDFGPDADLPESDQTKLFDNDLSWLEKLETGVTEQPQEMPFSEEKPPQAPEDREAKADDQYAGWLSQIVKTEPEEQPPAFTSDIGQEAISTADLPSWLKAMRPMEALDLEGRLDLGDQEQPEKAGPLAGLIGALPAEPEIIRSVKPPAYALRPQISEMHAAQASMLAELLAQEGSPKPLPHTPIVKFQSLQRISIGVILFVVIFFSLLATPLNFGPPALNAQAFAVNQLVSSIPPGSPVLVAVDYSPGFSGEMAVNLEPVLAHIRAGGGHLALVSTLPVGPLQAEQLMHTLTPGAEAVNQSAYTNLGFIPGGLTGILAFAQDPRSVVAFDTNGENAWIDPALIRLDSINDFSLILVASENPDTVRMWIEQTQPLRGDTPMIVVSSAQNEPVIRPYYDSYPRQVQGLSGGLSASAQYEVLSGGRGSALAFWPTFLLALTVVVLMILVGSVVNAALSFVNRKNSMKRIEGKE